MFLYPLTFFGGLSPVSCVSFSTLSKVSGSPTSPLTEPAVELGGEMERAPGEVERVMGGLTAVESAVEVVVEREVVEPVRRREAARRGLLLTGEMEEDELAPMRAASWFREGRRPPDGARSDLETVVVAAGGGAAAIAVCVNVDGGVVGVGVGVVVVVFVVVIEDVERPQACDKRVRRRRMLWDGLCNSCTCGDACPGRATRVNRACRRRLEWAARQVAVAVIEAIAPNVPPRNIPARSYVPLKPVHSASLLSRRGSDPIAVRMTHFIQPHAARLKELAVEISGLDKDIAKLQAARQKCIDQRNEILHSQMRASAISRKPSMDFSVSSADVRMDYYGHFEWSQELRLRMKTIFNIDDFRLCQEGCVLRALHVPFRSQWSSVCNANMDGRDIICIMPTGDAAQTPTSARPAPAHRRPLSPRWRQVTNVPAPRTPRSRLHRGHITAHRSHDGPDHAPYRGRQ